MSLRWNFPWGKEKGERNSKGFLQGKRKMSVMRCKPQVSEVNPLRWGNPLVDIQPHVTGKNNRFPFLDILGYLKNTHKNPKFGRVRQVPIRELTLTCLTLPNLGFLWVLLNTLKYPKMGIRYFFLQMQIIKWPGALKATLILKIPLTEYYLLMRPTLSTK